MFSPRGMLAYVAARTWLRALVITVAALLLYQQPAAVWIAVGLLVFVIGGEFYRYARSWQARNELFSKHSALYERVLAGQIAEHSIDALIASGWVFVCVALERSSRSENERVPL